MRRRSLLGSLFAALLPAVPAVPAVAAPKVIRFPAIASLGPSNSLDEYEEGVFTPTGTQYTRIGDFVLYDGRTVAPWGRA